MKELVRRALARAARPMLELVEQRQVKHHRDVVERIGKLDSRIDEVLATRRLEARLHAARVAAQHGHVPIARGSRIPPTIAPPDAVSKMTTASRPEDVVQLSTCPVCGHGEWTPVAEYNRFLFQSPAPDGHAERYDYALCHACGVVSARLRPVGERYRQLLERFEETLGRRRKDHDQPHVMGSKRLSDEDRVSLTALATAGVFVSEESRVPRVRALSRDRLEVAPHVEVIGSLLDLRAPRVLELRPRFGALGAALRRLYGGETFTLPLFEAQQLLVREVYHSHAERLIDFDRFQIPYEGTFDLVVANHLMTHAVRPSELLSTVRERLAPNGHLYLYNEPDESDFLDGTKSMFRVLNPFHLQTFDRDSLARALRSAGFEPVFLSHHRENLVALARIAPARQEWKWMSAKRREKRVARYARARDRSILMVPERLQGRFAHEWPDVVERAYANGQIEFDAEGHLRLVKRMHPGGAASQPAG